MIKILDTLQEKFDIVKDFLQRTDLRLVVGMIIGAAFIVTCIVSGAISVSEFYKKRSAHIYFSTITSLYGIDGEEYETKIMKIYQSTSHPLYKMLIGIGAASSLKTYGKMQALTSLLTELTHISGVPEYISDAIKLQLAGLQAADASKVDDAYNFMQKVKIKNRVLTPLLEEMLMDIKFTQNKDDEYRNDVLKLYTNKDMPRHMLRRLDEMRYIMHTESK